MLLHQLLLSCALEVKQAPRSQLFEDFGVVPSHHSSPNLFSVLLNPLVAAPGGTLLRHLSSLLLYLIRLVGGPAGNRVSCAFRLAGDGRPIPFGSPGNEIACALRTGIFGTTCGLREDGKRTE